MIETRRRKAPRLTAALSVQIIGPKGSAETSTIDVSRSGLFLHTLEPKPLRYLLRLRIDPVDGGEPIVGHGMVVRVVDTSEADNLGSEPGMGIEFFGFGGEPRARWEKLLERLEATAAGEELRRRSEPPLSLQPLRCDAAHKLPSRENVLLLLGTENVEQLYEICEHHIPAASVFVQTTARLPDGAPVDLRITHPLSRDIYDLHGTIERVAQVSGGTGLQVKLMPGVETRHQTFKDFIEQGLPEEELSLEFVKE